MTVAVVGGGTMGAGIAHVFLVAGAEVVLVEADEARAGTARDRVAESLTRAGQRGKLPDGRDAGAYLGGLRVVTDIAAVPAETELFVEAVPEDADLKRRILAAAEAAAPEAVLASNTSSLSVGELAKALRHPERCCGMHFFNPVPASALLEVVRHPGTASSTLAAVTGWAVRLGLEPVTVSDVPGFATSRLGVCVGLEAIRMVEEGVAGVEDIDKAMCLGYRWPVGPLRLTDLVGLDVRLAIAEHLASTLGPRFSPPELLRAKVAAGELGRKTGRGFYRW